MERFARTERLLGEKCFQHLQSRMVTVVGLGAVGGYAVEGLVRAGIQHLRIIDFDTIQPTNINRQIIALETTIGQAGYAGQGTGHQFRVQSGANAAFCRGRDT